MLDNPALWSALDKLPAFTGISYRGLDGAIGAGWERVTDGAATSRDPRVASQNFQTGAMLAFLHRTAGEISQLSAQPAELEVIIRPGTQWQPLSTVDVPELGRQVHVLFELGHGAQPAEWGNSAQDVHARVLHDIRTALSLGPAQLAPAGKFDGAWPTASAADAHGGRPATPGYTGTDPSSPAGVAVGDQVVGYQQQAGELAPRSSRAGRASNQGGALLRLLTGKRLVIGGVIVVALIAAAFFAFGRGSDGTTSPPAGQSTAAPGGQTGDPAQQTSRAASAPADGEVTPAEGGSVLAPKFDKNVWKPWGGSDDSPIHETDAQDALMSFTVSPNQPGTSGVATTREQVQTLLDTAVAGMDSATGATQPGTGTIVEFGTDKDGNPYAVMAYSNPSSPSITEAYFVNRFTANGDVIASVLLKAESGRAAFEAAKPVVEQVYLP